MIAARKLCLCRKGFTLIELIVVIVILGILAMIAVPRLSGFTGQAKESLCETHRKDLMRLVVSYMEMEGSDSDLRFQQLVSEYYGDEAICPEGGLVSYADGGIVCSTHGGFIAPDGDDEEGDGDGEDPGGEVPWL